MILNLYGRVRFVGPVKDHPGLCIGDIGYIIEDYENGNYEVEFSNSDGSTRVQAVITGSHLVLAEN